VAGPLTSSARAVSGPHQQVELRPLEPLFEQPEPRLPANVQHLGEALVFTPQLADDVVLEVRAAARLAVAATRVLQPLARLHPHPARLLSWAGRLR
jgi:hypothetical protein